MKNLKPKSVKSKVRNDARPNGKAWSKTAGANRVAQGVRALNNIALRAEGVPTLWQIAKAKRSAMRAAKRQQIHAPARGLTA